LRAAWKFEVDQVSHGSRRAWYKTEVVGGPSWGFWKRTDGGVWSRGPRGPPKSWTPRLPWGFGFTKVGQRARVVWLSSDPKPHRALRTVPGWVAGTAARGLSTTRSEQSQVIRLLAMHWYLRCLLFLIPVEIQRDQFGEFVSGTINWFRPQRSFAARV